jgi:anthranilate phosphoribosyltransferase
VRKMIREAIAKLVAGESLSREEAVGAMEEIMAGEATGAQIGAFLAALRVKGETVEEIAGLATVMRAKARTVQARGPVVDTCGTGGDATGTINISTAAALVAAGAGLTVAKHGNRAMTSRCGSADVLEALGVNITLGPAEVAECLDQVGVGFMFAPLYHPAMRHAAGPRKELGIRTVFNILGPLTNPAGAEAQVLGVPSAELVDKMARVLLMLGARHCLVVHGEDGVDELSISAPSRVAEVRAGAIRLYTVAPEDAGLDRAGRDELIGGTAEENAARLRGILEGTNGGARRVVLLNAAAALVAGDAAADLREGVALAAGAIDRGAARSRLDGLVELSQRLGRAPTAAVA